jgi:hypothetical protein
MRGLGFKKGQLTSINVVSIVFSLLIFFILLPIMDVFIGDCETYLLAHPSDMTDLLITVIHLAPFFVLLAILITAISYASPQREGRY